MSDGEEWRGDSEPDHRRSFSLFGWGGREMTDEEKAHWNADQEEKLIRGRMRATLLTRFRDEGRCVKCGHPKATTVLCRGGKGMHCVEHVGDVEHLHRDCKRCGHTWYELPLDAETL